MVKCWNCKHLVTAYSGKAATGKLFQKELRKCRVKGIALGYYEIREERNCEGFEQSKRWPKAREPYIPSFQLSARDPLTQNYMISSSQKMVLRRQTPKTLKS